MENEKRFYVQEEYYNIFKMMLDNIKYRLINAIPEHGQRSSLLSFVSVLL